MDVARSLASACPNAWVDVQTLASGVDIPHTTASVSRWSFAQVVFLSENYLGSRACLLEFFTALLRRQAWQHLLVYCKFRTRPDPRPRLRPEKRAANKTL